MTVASQTVTRRALLGAGLIGLAAAGCGPPDEPAVVASDVLGDQLRASQAVVASYEGVSGVDRLRSRARARVKRLEAAVRGAGGTVGPLPPAPAAPGLEAALAAERSALQTHVQGVGLLADRPTRELLAGLIADTAQNETALVALLHRRPLATPFPGQPPR